MIIRRYDKTTAQIDFIFLEDCLEHTEGSGYWKKGTVKQMLEDGNEVFTPFYIYSKA